MKLSTHALYIALSILLIQAFPIHLSAQDRTPGLHTLVLDPGHGGKDPGCVSKDGKTYEKDIVLKISTKLKASIEKNHPDVKVYLTRSDDKFVPLNDRAKYATQKGADFFISVHVNASDRSTSLNGYSVHLLGQSTDKNKDTYAYNMDLVKRENDVIMLEDDYTTTYEGLDASGTESDILAHLMHNAYREQSLEFGQLVSDCLKPGPFKKGNGITQNNFAVLRLASMPAMLIELGYMTNPTDLSILRKDESINKIVSALSKAFDSYKAQYDESVGVTSAPKPAPEAKPSTPQKEEAPKEEAPAPEAKPADTAVFYGTQILATTKVMSAKDSFFKGYQPTDVSSGKLIRYVIGTSENLDEARKLNKEIRAKFPDSFLVKVENNACTRVY